MHRMLLVSAVACLAASAAMAQDPVKVDPQHHTVMFENEQVRVLRVHYGPHEKSAMHSNPNAVVIFLSNAGRKSTTPDGKSVERHGKAGETKWAPAETHTMRQRWNALPAKSKPMIFTGPNYACSSHSFAATSASSAR